MIAQSLVVGLTFVMDSFFVMNLVFGTEVTSETVPVFVVDLVGDENPVSEEALVEAVSVFADALVVAEVRVFVVAWRIVDYAGLLQEMHWLVADCFLSFAKIK